MSIATPSDKNICVVRKTLRTLPLTIMAGILSLTLFSGMTLAQTQKGKKKQQIEQQRGSFKPAPNIEVGTLEEPRVQDSAQDHVSHRAIDSNDFQDPANPGSQFLQSYREIMRTLPQDTLGFPDWMRALREGTIKPRAGMSDKESMDVLNLDIIMRNTQAMPNVRFPHNAHTMWLACSNCHPEPFAPVAGGNRIVMADIFRGKFCGMCHDRVAFITFFSCDRCHSVPQAAPANR